MFYTIALNELNIDYNASSSTCSLQGKRLDAEKTTGRKGSQLFPLEFCTLKKYSVSLS